VDIELKDLHGLTSLVFTLNIGDREICKLLIDHGADLNTRSGQGYDYLVPVLSQNHDSTFACVVIRRSQREKLAPNATRAERLQCASFISPPSSQPKC
jgi:ankyrin repeat protein